MNKIGGELDMGQIFPALLAFQPNEASMHGQRLCDLDQKRVGVIHKYLGDRGLDTGQIFPALLAF